MKRTSVLLADDHVILTETIGSFLRERFDLVGIAHDGEMMLEIAKLQKPDVIVADISMPQLNGIDASRIVRKELRSTKIIFLTMHADLVLLKEAFRVGSGLVLKLDDPEELVKAIRVVAQGQTYISPMVPGELISSMLMTHESRQPFGTTKPTVRQSQMLQLLAEGKTMKQAASVMHISTRTAESHKYETMRRLGVQTTAELIRYAIRIKLV